MSEHITRLQYQDKEIILVGTAHVSEESVELVRETIAAEMPDSVCVELDEGRYQNLKNPRAWQETNVSQVIREKKVLLLLVQLVMSAYQRRIAKQLDTKVGGEMLQAIDSAEAQNAKLVLADRAIQTTFLRIWRLLGAKEKCKLLVGLVGGADEADDITESDIQTLMQQDMLESILADVKDEFPIIAKVLIHERDQFLANKIKHAPGSKVLAVLGAAHIPGVQEEIYKEQDMEQIGSTPAKKTRRRWLAWALPVLILGLIVYGFVQNWDTGVQNLTAWFLWNGALAALFTALSLAHPLSILTAFVTAPLTTFTFFLASGWFAGLVEAWVRKPRVEDIQNIPDDISFRGFYRNRFLKVLMVVILANLGSSIGTFVGISALLRGIF